MNNQKWTLDDWAFFSYYLTPLVVIFGTMLYGAIINKPFFFGWGIFFLVVWIILGMFAVMVIDAIWPEGDVHDFP